MASLLHPVGDGIAIGNVAVVGGVERFAVLSPALDGNVTVEANQAAGFDTVVQARGPIALGDGALRGRFARIAGDGGVEVSVGLWRSDPRRATSAPDLIAETKNFTVWDEGWQEYSLPIIGRECDQVAEFMGDLWIRTTVVNAISGTSLPTLGIEALWVEVPDAADGVTFQNPTANPPPADTLVTVRTFSGRSASAKNVGGEWFDASDQPFEAASNSLPRGLDGRIQAPRAVNGWGT